MNCHRALIFPSNKNATTFPSFMGIITVHCPIEPTLFGTTAVFFSSTYCPHCRVRHEWFVKDAWVIQAGQHGNARGYVKTPVDKSHQEGELTSVSGCWRIVQFKETTNAKILL
jgi:hypothetical protein